MKVIYQNESSHLIRFDRGEEVLTLLRPFCQDNSIFAGTFWGLGAASNLILAEYDLDKQAYKEKKITNLLEIASLTGNIARDKESGEVMLHAHGVFATLEQTHAGHVMELQVGVTCEISLNSWAGEIHREHDPAIGLKLLS